MRIILNLIWLVLCGIWMAIAYAVAGLLCFALFFLIVTIPFGIAAFRIANYVLWPFGRAIAPREGGMGIGSLIGNIIWIILFGWELAIGHLVAGILLCVTIIGIPLGLASFKIIPVSLVPLGVRIVPADKPAPSYPRREPGAPLRPSTATAADKEPPRPLRMQKRSCRCGDPR